MHKYLCKYLRILISMLTTDFIQRASLIHSNKYEYKILSKQVIAQDKITAICKKHGEFKTRVHDHIYHKSGCPTCAKLSKSNFKTFIKDAIEKHDNRYDYSKVEYINNYTKIKIICKTHGEFLQEPLVHLNASIGCPECKVITQTKTQEQFIKEANKIHNNQYNYDETMYINTKQKIKIRCMKHGIFEQIPDNHLTRGSGCPICANLKKLGTYNSGKSTIKKKNNNNTGLLYIAQFISKDEKFLKVGITMQQGVNYRYGIKHHGYEVQSLFQHILPILDANKLEQLILKKFSKYQYIPCVKFGGYTECINNVVKNTLLEYTNKAIGEIL